MSGFALKIIAVTTMLIDHFGAAFTPWLGRRAQIFRMVGRISFPIYVFLIAEGCRQTKDIRRYAARLGLFALVSEPLFDMLFESVRGYPSTRVVFFSLYKQNVFFTLFLGVCAVCWLKWRRGSGTLFSPRIIVDALVVALFAFLAELLRADYGALGVLAIVLCYAAPNRALQLLVLFALVARLYWGNSLYQYMLMTGGVTSLVFVALYNGERGAGGSRLKWFFYASYPVHILLLFVAYEVCLRFIFR